MKFVRMIVPLTLLGVAGFAQEVQYGFDHKADFAKYKTHKWVEVKVADQLDQLTDKQLKDAINVQLSEKNLVKTTDADLLIIYQAAISQQVQFTAYTELPRKGRREATEELPSAEIVADEPVAEHSPYRRGYSWWLVIC